MAKNEIAVIEKKMSPAIKEANAIEIKTADDMKEATEVLSVLNRFSDAMTKEKERVTKPLNEALKAERARWKPLEGMYESAIAVLRRKMTDWQTAEKKRADAEQAKIAARVGEGKGKLKVETAVQKMQNVDTPDRRVTTNAGMVKFQTMAKVEIKPMKEFADAVSKMGAFELKTLIENEMIVWNDSAVRKTVLAAKTASALPGVRYYTEEVPVNTR